jgi:putative transposase
MLNMIDEMIDEFTREYRRVGAKTAYIKEPRSPWDKGYVESFTARLRDELKCFTLHEAPWP